MTVELLQLLSLVSYILAGVSFLTAVALFFLLGVPKLFGDVTGSTARKAIESIRQQNEATGDKAYKPSYVNAKRGKLTDKILPTGQIEQRENGIGVNVGTEKLSSIGTAQKADETTVLNGNQSETSVLYTENPVGETTVLEQEENKDEFSVDFVVGFIGSSEIIE